MRHVTAELDDAIVKLRAAATLSPQDVLSVDDAVLQREYCERDRAQRDAIRRAFESRSGDTHLIPLAIAMVVLFVSVVPQFQMSAEGTFTARLIAGGIITVVVLCVVAIYALLILRDTRRAKVAAAILGALQDIEDRDAEDRSAAERAQSSVEGDGRRRRRSLFGRRRQ